MASGDVDQIQLRRYDTSTTWGFRMQGGTEYNMPLYIAQVNSKSIAGKAGLRSGDAILQMDKESCQGWSHAQAKQHMMRAGNEVDFFVQRGAVSQEAMQPESEQHQAAKRSEIDQGSINPGMNAATGSSYRNVMPKSYRMLEAQLGGPEGAPPAPAPSVLGQKKAQPSPAPKPAAAAPAQAEGAKPSSIFDRKKQDRSDYLKAQGQTIQKAYGQQ